MGANGKFDRVLLPFGKLHDMWLVIGEAFKCVYDNVDLDSVNRGGGTIISSVGSVLLCIEFASVINRALVLM